MADMTDIKRFIDAADNLINAVRTEKPAIDANPMLWTKIEARIQKGLDEYEVARAALIGDDLDSEPEEPHNPL